MADDDDSSGCDCASTCIGLFFLSFMVGGFIVFPFYAALVALNPPVTTFCPATCELLAEARRLDWDARVVPTDAHIGPFNGSLDLTDGVLPTQPVRRSAQLPCFFACGTAADGKRERRAAHTGRDVRRECDTVRNPVQYVIAVPLLSFMAIPFFFLLDSLCLSCEARLCPVAHGAPAWSGAARIARHCRWTTVRGPVYIFAVACSLLPFFFLPLAGLHGVLYPEVTMFCPASCELLKESEPSDWDVVVRPNVTGPEPFLATLKLSDRLAPNWFPENGSSLSCFFACEALGNGSVKRRHAHQGPNVRCVGDTIVEEIDYFDAYFLLFILVVFACAICNPILTFLSSRFLEWFGPFFRYT